MALSYTFHGITLREDAQGTRGPVIGKASAARVDVADGAASSALASTGFYRIAASTTSYVLIDSAATNGTGGEHFPAGHVEVRWLTAGDKIGCSAGV